MRHTIAIAIYGESTYLKACLAAIAKNTTVDHEVFVVNTKEPRISVAAAWNTALRMGTGEFCTVLNDDTLVSPGWLRRLENGLLESPEYGCVSPTLSACWDKQKKPFRALMPGVNPNTMSQADVDILGAKIASVCRGQRVVRSFLCGCCLTFRRSLFEQIDGFDSGFFPAYGEDDDWCDRVIEAGYKCIWVKDAYVHHFYRKTRAKVSDLDHDKSKARLAMKRKLRAEKCLNQLV